MSESKAAMLRFLYVFFRARGLPKERAEAHLREAATFNEHEFTVFVDELTVLLSNELQAFDKEMN